LKYVAAHLALYAATLALLVRFEHFGIVEPLLILAVVGGAFTLIAWLLTRHSKPLPVAEPRGGLLWYFPVVAAFTTWGLGAVTASQPMHDIVVLVAKLAVFGRDRGSSSIAPRCPYDSTVHSMGDLRPNVIDLARHFSQHMETIA